jgi:hypothetical protein
MEYDDNDLAGEYGARDAGMGRVRNLTTYKWRGDPNPGKITSRAVAD